MRHFNYGRYERDLDLQDTPLARAGYVWVCFRIQGWHFPETRYEPEDYGTEVMDFEITGDVTDEEMDILNDYIQKECNDLVDWDRVDWDE